VAVGEMLLLVLGPGAVVRAATYAWPGYAGSLAGGGAIGDGGTGSDGGTKTTPPGYVDPVMAAVQAGFAEVRPAGAVVVLPDVASKVGWAGKGEMVLRPHTAGGVDPASVGNADGVLRESVVLDWMVNGSPLAAPPSTATKDEKKAWAARLASRRVAYVEEGVERLQAWGFGPPASSEFSVTGNIKTDTQLPAAAGAAWKFLGDGFSALMSII
jgi:hypothetical protein